MLNWVLLESKLNEDSVNWLVVEVMLQLGLIAGDRD